MQKIIPFLWFDTQAEEAMNYYVSLFADSRVVNVTKGPDGKVMTVTFELEGQRFMGLNGGPQFPFTEAISLFVSCESQSEVDGLWEKLCAGGKPGRCGWLKDKFGLSWQIIPKAFGEMLGRADAAQSGRVIQAMMGMGKLDLGDLQRAFEGE